MFENKIIADMLRTDFYSFMVRSFRELNPGVPFLPNWHLEVLAAKLQACAEGKIKRLIINLPPRGLKSHAASVALPAYLLGLNPSTKIIAASYGQDLSNSFGLQTRTLMMSPFYKATFATRISRDKNAVNDFATTRGGYRLATSVDGALTGRGGDLIIMDDPLKPAEAASETQRDRANAWFGNTVSSRLNNKTTGSMLTIMQRLHEDDLSGYLLNEEGWELLSIPSIAEQDETYEVETVMGRVVYRRSAGSILQSNRDSANILADLRRSMGEETFSAQYQQQPIPPGGAIIKTAWLKRYSPDRLPEIPKFVHSWDTAIKPQERNDYSACTVWGIGGDGTIYLVHAYRARLEFPDLKRAVIDMTRVYPASQILIEDKASGSSLIQELQREGLYEVIPYPVPSYDKVMRTTGQTAKFENGLVRIPESGEWVPDYIHELTAFPGGKHDDQVDSTINFLDWYSKNWSRSVYDHL